MAKSYVRRKNAPPLTALTPKGLEQATKTQLQASVGAGEFQYRNPIAHVRESFRQSFDGLGRQAVQNRRETGGLDDHAPGTSGVENQTKNSPSSEGSSEDAMIQKTWMDPEYAPRHPGQEDRFYQKFSETAFQRGKLSGAVLSGTGRVMLFSCLKRTMGQMDPQHIQQRKLFQATSAHKQVPGNPQNLAIYNKGYADSAIALVVDVLSDAQRTVESMTKLAQAGGSGAKTLQTMYPFLDDSRELALIEQYQSLIAQNTLDPEQERVLKGALSRTRTVIANKHQMKEDFISALNHISYRASTALAVFSQDAFRQALHERLRAVTADSLPPEDSDDAGFSSDDFGADVPPGTNGPDSNSTQIGGTQPELGTDTADEGPQGP